MHTITKVKFTQEQLDYLKDGILNPMCFVKMYNDGDLNLTPEKEKEFKEGFDNSLERIIEFVVSLEKED